MTKPVPAGLASLTDFRPASPSQSIHEHAAPPMKAIAEAHGFVERNPVVPRKRRKPVDEPTHSFTARVSVRSANAFIEWCERERISYREGFDRLVGLIDRA
ncbi:hypothetical protein [Microvirga aerophila]|nr:hypothetical protein [Microvirga aerophila]